MSRNIIIIGAGIAGLSAGCYGQMNGYRTQIFELHSLPGGLCTSWKRQGYTFDGCIHWLVGTRPGSSFHGIWQELGALQDREVIDHEEFMRVAGEGGKAFIIYTDVDRLEQHMKELAPADAPLIEELCNGVRRFAHSGDMMGAFMGSSRLLVRIKAAFKILPLLGAFRKYSRMPVTEFASRFSDSFLRETLSSLFSLTDLPMLALLMTLAWQHNRDAGYPVGGSLSFSQAIERRYLDLGGEIHYRSRVVKILVENDRAVGVRLEDGSEHRADFVISAADGHATIFDMLQARYINDQIREYYDEWPIFQPLVLVSLGVARDLSGEPHTVSLFLEEPITIAGEERWRMSTRHFCYDPSMAPPGKSVLSIAFESNYQYWKDLQQTHERYSAEKEGIVEAVIGQLEKRLPGIREQIEAVDVATPLTFERYTGNWQGSMEGWLLTTKTMGMMGRGMEKTLPGLSNLFMAGQWVEPGGGVPTAAMSARGVIQLICKQDEKAFKTIECGPAPT